MNYDEMTKKLEAVRKEAMKLKIELLKISNSILWFSVRELKMKSWRYNVFMDLAYYKDMNSIPKS